MDTKTAGLFNYLLDLFKKDAINNLLVLLFGITHAKLAQGLAHQVRLVFVNSRSVPGVIFQIRRLVMQLLTLLRLLLALVPCSRRIFAFDHFRHRRKQWACFEDVSTSFENGTKSCIWAAEVLSLVSWASQSMDGENEYDFSVQGMKQWVSSKEAHSVVWLMRGSA